MRLNPAPSPHKKKKRKKDLCFLRAKLFIKDFFWWQMTIVTPRNYINMNFIVKTEGIARITPRFDQFSLIIVMVKMLKSVLQIQCAFPGTIQNSLTTLTKSIHKTPTKKAERKDVEKTKDDLIYADPFRVGLQRDSRSIEKRLVFPVFFSFLTGIFTVQLRRKGVFF